MRHVDLDADLFPVLHDVDVRRVAFAMAMTYAGRPSTFVERRFGRATAVRDASLSGVGLFNRVIGFGREDLEHLDEIIAFYEEARVPCQIDVTPNHATSELLAALDARGFATTGSSCVFRGGPEATPPSTASIEIAHATGSGLAGAVDLHRRFGERPPLDEAERARRVAFLSEHPEYMMFVASIGGQPAAVAGLLLLGDACHFANDCTDPGLQRRGCQRALLDHRIDVAARHGCRLAVTDTMFGTSSHRNVERSGFRLAYSLVWRVRPLGGALASG
jgi:GNAT superfamily N-acetyltransferase